MAPEGIRSSFTGGGDWRRLPCADPWPWWAAEEDVRPLAWLLASVVLLLIEGERRCLLRYEVDDTERGSAGRWTLAGEEGDCSQ